MTVVTVAGMLVILCNLLSAIGAYLQFSHNKNRGTIHGLSLLESEVRVWGKLPWFLYATACADFDASIVTASLVSIAVPLLVLSQFWQHTVSYAVRLRVIFQFLLCAGTGYVCLFTPHLIDQHRATFQSLPLVITIVSLFLANGAQIATNVRYDTSEGISVGRYRCFVLCNFIWLAYGVAKLTSVSGNEGITIIATAMVGLFANSLVVAISIAQSRKPAHPLMAPAIS